MEKKGAIIVARHGERIDYYLRDAGSNWLQGQGYGNERKWDPPLTHRGQMQARKLGEYLHKMIERHDLAPIGAVYSSPMVRCCMTAGEAAVGYMDCKDSNASTCSAAEDSRGENLNSNQKGEERLNVIVEEGLVESMNDKWYRSWGLPDSDGTWGGKGGSNYKNGVFPPKVQDDAIDARAKGPVHLLIRDPEDTSKFLVDYGGHPGDTSLSLSLLESLLESESQLHPSVAQKFKDSKGVASLICTPASASTEPIFSIQGVDYKWGDFEFGKTQQDRMEHVVETLSKRHPNETILLVSHGAPVTNLFARLTGNDWSVPVHGVCSYTSFSIYQKDGQDQGGAGGSLWKALATNDSTHVKEMHMEAADETSSFVS